MRRVTLSVHIDLDEIPGSMHTPESAQEIVTQILRDRMDHYNPVVTLGRLTENGELVPTQPNIVVYVDLDEDEAKSSEMVNLGVFSSGAEFAEACVEYRKNHPDYEGRLLGRSAESKS